MAEKQLEFYFMEQARQERRAEEIATERREDRNFKIKLYGSIICGAILGVGIMASGIYDSTVNYLAKLFP